MVTSPVREGKLRAGVWTHLRASGRAAQGGCLHCLMMLLICCVGCGKCSELSVEYRTSSGEAETVKAGGQVRPWGPVALAYLGSLRTWMDTHWILEQSNPELGWGQPQAC